VLAAVFEKKIFKALDAVIEICFSTHPHTRFVAFRSLNEALEKIENKC